MKVKALTKAKDTEVKTKVEAMGVKVRSSRHVERPGKKEGEVITEDLATIELADGTTITVDVNDPDYDAKVERAQRKVLEDIANGKRVRKVE